MTAVEIITISDIVSYYNRFKCSMRSLILLRKGLKSKNEIE